MAVVRTPRSRWIEEGLRALIAGGPEAVRIEPLAQAIGVSKGGFYWAFADRQALLDELLDAWERTSVDAPVTQIDPRGGRDALLRLFALAREHEEILVLDVAVRDWARRDAAVAERLRRVDERRMAFLRAAFGAFCPPEEVEPRALSLMALWVAGGSLGVEHPGRTRAEVLGGALSLLLA